MNNSSIELGYWAKPKIDIESKFDDSITLDKLIPGDHMIRGYDLLLNEFDWSKWESKYNLTKGQPPIHPMYLAGILLYGMSERIRSSRDLEKACSLRLDFMWFLKGQKIDHSTICNFRKDFEEELKDLSKQIKILAKELLGGGTSVSTDGTKIRSNSSRHGARTAKSIAKKLEALDKELMKNLEAMTIQDTLDNPNQATVPELDKANEKIKKTKEILEKAKEVALARDIIKQKKDGKKATAVRVPITDTDSHIGLNKDGGYAPNFTPLAVVDNDTGIIVQCDIPKGSDEASTVPSAIEEIEGIFGEKPREILFDGSFKTGPNLKYLAENNVQAVAPIFNVDGNPAIRENARIPVLESEFQNLPLHGKHLDKSVFIYEEENDIYLCPMGKEMQLIKTTTRKNNDDKIKVKTYSCQNCEDCPLKDKCSTQTKNRTVLRDEYEPLREDLAKYMKGPGKAVYKKRAPNSEGCFAHIKGNLGIRQFLLRSLEKVKIEWEWICSACNIRKLAKIMTK